MKEYKLAFTEVEILEELDSAHKGLPGKYYPESKEGDIKYNFFLDLEHGYCVTAGNKIHLYADQKRWAVVFEVSGYKNRGFNAVIQLDYVGNCIDYPIEKHPERNYITNSNIVVLIESQEFERIENKEGSDMEKFELIRPTTKDIKVRDTTILFECDFNHYEKLGIKIRDLENPRKMIGFGDLIRYLNETSPKLISARDEDIRKHIPFDLPKLMTINEFNYVSLYEEGNPPSKQETYLLIAKILLFRNPELWKPTLKTNNHWSNWQSGWL